MPQPEKELTPWKSPQHWFGAELRLRRKAEGLKPKQLGRLVQVSDDMILSIEKGQYPSCRRDLAHRLDEVLGTDGLFGRAWEMAFARPHADKKQSDADKGRQSSGIGVGPQSAGRILGRDEPPSPGDPVNRRVMLQASGLAALTPLDAFAPTQLMVPDVIGANHIDQVQKVASDISGWDNRFGGGGLVRDLARSAMHWSVGLLGARCSEHLRPNLLAAVSRLGIVVGASAFDACAHDEGTQAFKFAAHCADEADHWHLRAKSYSLLARQAVWIGQPDDGLTYAEKGLVRSDRLTATTQAMLHTARARAFGKLGNVRDCLAAVGQADNAFADACPAEDPTWMAYYDAAQHNGDTAHALFDLSLLAGQDPGRAVRRFEAAVNGHSERYERSRAISRTKLATLLMARSDPRYAAVLGNEAMDEVGRLTSRRAKDDLRQLGAFAAKHPRIPEAAELRRRITGAVTS